MGEGEVLALASRQDGVVRRAQAIQLGMTVSQVRSRVARGRLVRVHPGVLRVAGSAEHWRQRLRAVSLWLGRDFAFSHRTAAALWGIEGFVEGSSLEARVVGRPRPSPGITITRTRALLPRELAFQGGFRVTSIPRTLVDLASVLRRARTAEALDAVLRRRFVSLDVVARFLDRHRHERGARTLRALVREREGLGGPPESKLEARVLALLSEARLPRPVLQERVRVKGGLARLDFRFEGTPVIEADGYAYHSTLACFEADRRRRNALTSKGFVILHWTWQALDERPDELVAEVAHVLAASMSGAKTSKLSTSAPLIAQRRGFHRAGL